jgi:hypothetical protein
MGDAVCVIIVNVMDRIAKKTLQRWFALVFLATLVFGATASELGTVGCGDAGALCVCLGYAGDCDGPEYEHFCVDAGTDANADQ